MKIDTVHVNNASEKAAPMKKQQTITLWSVIESMQRKLEKQGMDETLVDATIKRRLRARRYSPGFRQSALAGS